LKFDRDSAFPATLLKKIIKYRITEINESFPKKSGEFKEFYKSGQLKAEGSMKKNELHGAWKWYRADGSLLRSGHFKNGVQNGEWVTYLRDGQAHKITNF
jgi:antitoxin component YwqK of YwqJK toxin-antitoxin module